jgi:hypothetical protein
MTDQVPERSEDVPSTGDLGDHVVCVVVGREATNEELGNYRVVIEVGIEWAFEDQPGPVAEIVKDTTGGARIAP